MSYPYLTWAEERERSLDISTAPGYSAPAAEDPDGFIKRQPGGGFSHLAFNQGYSSAPSQGYSSTPVQQSQQPAYASDRGRFNSLAAGTNPGSSFNRLMATNPNRISGVASYRGQPTNLGYNDALNSAIGYDDFRREFGPVNLPDAPTYANPEVDEAGVDRYTRSNLAPMLSRLRSALNQNVLKAKNEDNPNVRKLYTGAAMTGYGDALSSASASARNTGRNDYMNMEYRPQVQAAQTNFTNATNKWRTESQDLINRRNAAMSSYRA